MPARAGFPSGTRTRRTSLAARAGLSTRPSTPSPSTSAAEDPTLSKGEDTVGVAGPQLCGLSGVRAPAGRAARLFESCVTSADSRLVLPSRHVYQRPNKAFTIKVIYFIVSGRQASYTPRVSLSSHVLVARILYLISVGR
eukprot:scaffold28742_cov69-Phaeocystis_antarctica.AAC.1